MDLTPIPKTFWYSLSLSVVLLSGAFVWVSVVEGRLTVKWDKLEVTAGEVEEKTIKLQAQVQSLKIDKEQANIALNELKNGIDKFSASLSECNDNEGALQSQLAQLAKGVVEQKSKNEEQFERLQETEKDLTVTRKTLGEIGVSSTRVPLESIVLINDSWAKEGYYLSLESDIRLNVDSVENQVAKIRISKGTDNITELLSLKQGESQHFEYKGSAYSIKLNSIGKAGFNPLKKAAYFTVVKNRA